MFKLICRAVAILTLLAPVLAVEDPPPPPIEINTSPMDSPDFPAGLSSDRARGLKISVKNASGAPLRIVWCDFFFQLADQKWVGGWWDSGLSFSEKISRLFASSDFESPILPPGGRIEYQLIDKWMSEVGKMDYKFACLVSGEDGSTSMFETPPVSVPSVPIDRSGVDRAVAGVSSALESLFTPSSSSPPDPAPLGVSVEHSPLGPVEISRSVSLKTAVSKWASSHEVPPSPVVHVYRTEIANNTLQPLRLALLEVATKVDGKWLTGYLRSPLVSSKEIAERGYLEEITHDEMPKIEKPEDNWLPSGARMVLPYQWHPSAQPGSPSPAMWKAVLITTSGSPVYAEGESPALLAPVLVPPPTEETPSEER